MYGLFTGCPKPGFVQIWDVYGKNMGFYAKSAGYYGKNTGFYGLSFFSGHLFLSKSVKVQKLCGKSMDIVSIMNFEGLYFDGYIPLVIPQSTHVSLEVLDVQWHCDFITPMGCELQVFSQPQIFHHFWEPS